MFKMYFDLIEGRTREIFSDWIFLKLEIKANGTLLCIIMTSFCVISLFDVYYE